MSWFVNKTIFASKGGNKKNYECFQCEENHWPPSQKTYAINLGLIANGGSKGEVERRKTWGTYDCLYCANSINFKVMFQKVT